MLKCASCGYMGAFDGKICPRCREPLVFGEDEARAMMDEAHLLMKRREYADALEIYRVLSGLEVTDAQREYAIILERGDIVARDLDGAERLFLRAATKNDPLSAYRYSRLASRVSDEASSFWLRYSAVLGCETAYPELARALSEDGREELATYFYYLAAESGDRDSAVEMALRYYRGNGATRSEAYAKWYLDKFFIPPIYALKVAYKLRSVKAQQPPEPNSKDYDAFLRSLTRDAERYKLDTAYYHLSTVLSARGDIRATLAVGASLIEGVGTQADIERGIGIVESAAVHGLGDAYGYLGSLYLAGELVDEDIELGVKYLFLAAENGAPDAYELLGDMYRTGDGVERNPSYAVELYELGAKGGSRGASVKAADMKRRREDFFDRGVALEDTVPTEAFRAFAISAAMGYKPAEYRLAVCYEHAIGTPKDRYAAFYWYKRSAECADPRAIFDLGRCYAYGIGVRFDYKTAIKTFMRSGEDEALVKREITRLLEAKKKRLVRSAFSRAMRLLYMKRFEPALEILELCVRLEHAQGIYTLGCLLEFGFGTRADRERAYKLYEKAYRLTFRDPRQTYKLKVLKMVR